MEDSSVFSIQSLALSCRAVTLGKHPPCSLEVGRSYQKIDGRFVVLFSFGVYQYVYVIFYPNNPKMSLGVIPSGNLT